MASITTQGRTGPGPVLLGVLGLLAGWAAAVPFLGPPLGFEVYVPATTEVATHVVPGAVVLVSAAGMLVVTARRGAIPQTMPSFLATWIPALAGCG